MRSGGAGLALSVAVVAFAAAGCGGVATPVPTATRVTPTRTAVRIAMPSAMPTWTPMPRTPVPPGSPPPSPTPIIYTVQGGDTLIAIARQYGISAESLQRANGITDPRRLQIGQVLMVPRPTPDANATGVPTPAPAAYRIRNAVTYLTPTGALWVLGEVENPLGEPVEQVQVAADLLDGDGAVLQTGTVATDLIVIPPGASVGFAILFSRAPAAFASYRVRPVRGDTTTHLGDVYLDWTVTEVAMRTMRPGLASISGRAINRGKQAASARVLVMLYDEAGRLTGLRSVVPSPTVVLPGRYGVFQADVVTLGGEPKRFRVAVEGRLEK